MLVHIVGIRDIGGGTGRDGRRREGEREKGEQCDQRIYRKE